MWQEIDTQTEIEERLMMGLRLSAGISYAEFEQKTGRDLRAHLNPEKLTFLAEQGLLVERPDRLQATLTGRLVLTQLTAELIC